jgi:AhpD family alkylhydroperoxidase
MRIDYQQVTPVPTRHLFSISAAIAASSLTATTRELVAVRISQLNGCAHCIAVHWEKARSVGVSETALRLLPAFGETRDETVYTPPERTALRLATALTSSPDTGIATDLWEEAVERMGEETLMWLIQHIMLMNSWNRLSIALRLDPPVH